ncbi:CRISPR-associated helicase Cas3' [Methanosphaera sp. ISO3-F5]|uniref:CRISPR-associated helicase Cas3' n=1 Tax=Methanosphaera sp. ISO3-F5 TaxID=1452353 RepID=UPI002B25EB8F|nr:CRISPR-associated helicase Cas3' [Methanosphaera sp. ISO3-F5]WQH63649.1 CRISPR-associated helicase Cas3' [Methanosphaera sp. ISO3-F5]
MSCYSEEIYSHPNILLTDHLLNVANNSRKIFENMNITDNKLYSDISFFIGLTHDFAKATSFFQDHLFNRNHSPNAYHGFLSAIFCYYVIKRKGNSNYVNFPVLGYLVVKNHHGNLKNIFDEHNHFKKNMDNVDVQVNDLLSRNLDSFTAFYSQYDIDVNYFLSNINEVKEDLKKDLFKFKREDLLDNYLDYILLFSVLIDSDKLDASHTSTYNRIPIDKNVVDKYKIDKKFNSEGINFVREEAFQELNSIIDSLDLDNKLYSISLPTGSGKTMNAFSFALKLRDRITNELNFMPRIIYSLPFLSIIDQNEEVIKDILSDNGFDSQDVFIKHNSMSEIYYKTSDNQELEIDNAEMLIESWYSEIIITTFYQFFYTIISNKNRSLKKLHNLSNSIVILDEVQSIPPKYWKLVNVLLKYMVERYNFWIIFMTATQPAIFSESEMIPLVENKEYYFNKFDRVNYKFCLEKQSVIEFNEFILDEILSTNKDIMIVVNTIQNSIDIYKYLSNYLEDNILYYLSTNIIPIERKKRISNIKKSENRKIIVTTQLIEAGVDIDVDIIYRDFAPIDSIVQTAGRCNRNQQKDKGTVNIIRLADDKKEYNKYIYDSISREVTYELIKDLETISEKDFGTIIDKYYDKILEKISKDSSKDIIKKLSKLEISNITNEFKLIEENVEKQDVFIDLNDYSHEIWNKYTEIYSSETSVIEKRYEFKKIKSEFRKYIISIDVKKLGTTPIEYNIGHIDRQDIERKYDEQIGFIPLDDEDAFII